MPTALFDLNVPEQRAIALGSIFSTTAVRQNKYKGIFRSISGTTSVSSKTSQHYRGMYSALIDDGGNEHESYEKVKRALSWLRDNNWLYKRFFSNYETLYRFFQSDKITFGFNHTVTHDPAPILADERAGLLIHRANVWDVPPLNVHDHILALQHPKTKISTRERDFEVATSRCPQYQEAIHDVAIKFADPYLEAKLFPSLYPYGAGQWHYTFTQDLPKSCRMGHGKYVRSRLLNWDPRFRDDPHWVFIQYDRKCWMQFDLYNRCILANRAQASDMSARDAMHAWEDNAQEPFDGGNNMLPVSLPGSTRYWRRRQQEVLAMSQKFGKPTFFTTLTFNDKWPELQQWVKKMRKHEGKRVRRTSTYPVVNHTVACAVAYERRFALWRKHVLSNKDGPYGDVHAFWWRHEYQKRGAIHTHIVLWCKDADSSNASKEPIFSMMPRCKDPPSDLRSFLMNCRQSIWDSQRHQTCKQDRCFKGWGNRKFSQCKYGYPQPLLPSRAPDDLGIRMLYPRHMAEDRRVVEFNPHTRFLWDGHCNDKHITNDGWQLYLAKYICKPEPRAIYPGKKKTKTKLHHCWEMSCRLVGKFEATVAHLGFHMCRSSHATQYLPMDAVHEGRVLKRPAQLQMIDSLGTNEQCYHSNLWDKYLRRPCSLHNLTYPDLLTNYRWDHYLHKHVNDDAVTAVYPDGSGRKGPKFVLDENSGGWRLRTKLAIPYWNFIAPVDEQSIERYYMQQLMLNVPYTSDDVQGYTEKQLTTGYLLSQQNATHTYLEEAIIQLGEDAQIDGMAIITNGAINGINIQKLRDWIHFLAQRGWLEEDAAYNTLDTIESLREDYQQTYMKVTEGHVVDEHKTSQALEGASMPKINFEDLTESQQKAYYYIANHLDVGHTLKVAIMGVAGTGKSFLLPPLVRLFNRRGMSVAIMAPTGIAAWTIGGSTIHRRFQINEDDQVCLSQGTNSWAAVQEADVIIIDEFSMLTCRHLDLIQQGCKRVMRRRVTDVQWQADFAGKHFILVGDPGQLQPIGSAIYDHPIFKAMDCLILHDITRQTNQDFMQLLHRIRIGAPDERDIAWMHDNMTTIDDVDFNHTTVIVATNRERQDINNHAAMMISDPSSKHTLVAEDTGDLGQPLAIGQRQPRVKLAQKRQALWPETLTIWKGARVMLLANQNVAAGEVNGMLGTVVEFKNDVIIVRNNSNGRLCPVFRRSQRCGRPTTLLIRKQYPLSLAYAVTCHKIQGQTLRSIAVKLSNGFKRPGQLYVALSRTKEPEDIKFLEIDDRSIARPFPTHFFDQFVQRDKLHNISMAQVNKWMSMARKRKTY